MSRGLLLAGLVLLQCTWAAPTRAELEKLYRKPTAMTSGPQREVYLARPGIQVVVTEFGPAGQACVLEISRVDSNTALSQEEMEPIFREIAPLNRRGKKLGKGSHEEGLGGGAEIYYENVWVGWNIYSNPPPNIANGASGRLAFVDSGCNPKPQLW